MHEHVNTRLNCDSRAGMGPGARPPNAVSASAGRALQGWTWVPAASWKTEHVAELLDLFSFWP